MAFWVILVIILLFFGFTTALKWLLLLALAAIVLGVLEHRGSW